MARIAIAATSFCKTSTLVQHASAALSKHDLIFNKEPSTTLAGDGLRSFLKDAHGALIGREHLDSQLIDDLPCLKAVALYGVGHDNVDIAALTKHGIAFYREPGVNAAAVAELAIGLMLACLRNISRLDHKLHQGLWEKNGGRQLTGKTVAVIGCGHVGSRVAKLLHAFSCRLLLCDLLVMEQLVTETGGQQVSFETALQQADIVTLHVPLTAATHHLISTTSLALMRPGSYLINTSRGGNIDDVALKKALQSGHLAGAGLDVFNNEPTLDAELCRLPQLVGTPHIGGNAAEAVEAMGFAAVSHLQRHFG